MIPVATVLGLAVAAVISIGLGTLLALANAPADLNDVCPDEVEP